MTSRRLLILSVAALIAIGAGVWLANRESSSSAGAARAALYPSLKEQLDAVQTVRIFKAGEAQSVELVRNDGGWRVSERAGYPADDAKLRKLLRSLADAKLYEEKTSNPDNYKSLGVEDVSDPAAAGIRLELIGAPANVNLIVGKAGAGAQSHYVRRAGEAKSWLVDASLDASASPDEWLRKEILDVSPDRIQSATVSVGKQRPYAAAKESRADAGFNVSGLPRGKKLSSPAAANGFSTVLGGLTLAGVQQASAFEGTAPAAHATFTTFDGLVVELDGWTREDKRFIAVTPAFDPTIADRFKVATTPDDDDKKDAEGGTPAQAADQPKTPDVAEEAKSANARLTGWVYEIPAYKYEQIFKPLEQLL